MTDAASYVAARPRSLTDTAGISDTCVAVLDRVVTVADFLALTDVAIMPPAYLPIVDTDHMRLVPTRGYLRTVDAREGRTVPARDGTRTVEARDTTRTVPARPHVRSVT